MYRRGLNLRLALRSPPRWLPAATDNDKEAQHAGGTAKGAATGAAIGHHDKARSREGAQV